MLNSSMADFSMDEMLLESHVMQTNDDVAMRDYSDLIERKGVVISISMRALH